MKELTKQQRNAIYKSAYEIHKNLGKYDYVFMCSLLKYRCGSLIDQFKNRYIEDEKLTVLLPEFFMFMPYNKAYAWFSGNYKSNPVKQHQRCILEFCIAMTE